MKNSSTKHIRKASKASILLFAGTTALLAKGNVILAIGLYAVFINRTGANASAKRFFRVLAKHGYGVAQS